jgi:hypothetical protein
MQISEILPYRIWIISLRGSWDSLESPFMVICKSDFNADRYGWKLELPLKIARKFPNMNINEMCWRICGI